MAMIAQRTSWTNYDSLRMHCLVSLNSTGKRITFVGYNACLNAHIRQSYTVTAAENQCIAETENLWGLGHHNYRPTAVIASRR